MSIIESVNGNTPIFGKECFLATNATVVGDVIMGDYCSVWFNAVVRGDVNSIKVGSYTNIQDGAVIHCTYQKTETTIGNYVSIAHNAIVHGCTIHDKVLVGMGAIVMDHSILESGSIIAAGSVVLENTHVEANSIYAGTPAKKVKEVGENMKDIFMRTANNYVKYSKWYDHD
ncbi:MAG: gamma carbonic anhydrase family protein [Bacteroidota bacterium]